MTDSKTPDTEPKKKKPSTPRPKKPKAEKPAEPAAPIAAPELPPAPEPEADTAEPNDANEPADPTAPAPIDPENPLKVPADRRVVIGITGEPGAGKSALARALVALNARTIDADRVGHELLDRTEIRKALVRDFGREIVDDQGGIDRRKLAAAAFATPETTAKLNAIMHPPLAARVRELVRSAGNFVVIDAALLHELGLAELCTATVYVRAAREVRTARVAEQRGWDDAELARREAALGNADQRRKACQLSVDNGNDVSLLAGFAKFILARQLGVDLNALKGRDDESRNDDRQQPPQGDRQQQHGNQPRHGDRQRHGGQNQGGQQQGNRQQQGDHQQQGNRQQQGDHQQQGDRQQQGNGGQPQQPERPPVKVNLDDYLKRTLPDLQGEADKLEVRDVKWLKKHDLICEILRRVAAGRMDEIIVQGFIELSKDQGYIRSPLSNYLAVGTDTFIVNQQIRRYGLKAGMHVTGVARAPRGNERGPQLLAIHTVMGEPEAKRTPVEEWENLTPLHAHERLFMELPNDPSDMALRIFDLVCPIGKGQRGMIVAQPKCGKTVYLQKIAKAITTNNPEVTLMVLLVDERPEEVTDMQRSVKGEVIASTFDQPASRHVQCAEMTINKAKRLVERGKDVVILLDSITRLARAYNTEAPGSGRVMSGGIESGALVKPRQFFAAARKIENGGSLTILATALVDTGSLADTVIFEEFKGTGNMELVLDRRLADRRIFPAINIGTSGTRKDDLLIKNKDELVRTWALRRFLAERSPQDAVEFIKGKLKNHRTNVEFLLSIDPEKVSSW